MKDVWILTHISGEPILPDSAEDCPAKQFGCCMLAYADQRDAESVRDAYNARDYEFDIRLLSEIRW
jgi:hypothetical protein